MRPFLALLIGEHTPYQENILLQGKPLVLQFLRNAPSIKLQEHHVDTEYTEGECFIDRLS